jgi:serine/threonine-protein kinase
MNVDGPPASGSLPKPPAPSLVGEVLDGRYKIVRKLGEGGMGEVYAAEHVHIEKRFAIKLLRPEIVSNPEAVKRFRQEARSASSIGHRNIIAIEDFGQLPDGRIYMCMELLNGAALNDLIQTPVAVDRLLNIMIQTGHALSAAHAKGIVHRDMKPENIFVTIGPAGEDVPKLLDFGIAKVAGNDGQNNLTRTGTIFGTPFYMAPEQALGNPVDARVDVYAMGVIMYELFAGSLPFQGDSFMGILTQHITTEPEPVAQRAARAGRQLPHGLAEIVTRCMQKNPAHRYDTMDELVDALIEVYRSVAGPGMSSYMEAFPVSAHPPVPTPPLTGPVAVSPISATYVVPTSPPATGPAGLPMTGPGGASASHPMYAGPSASASYAAPPPARSKAGLVIGVLAVLAVGAGIAVFAITSQGSGGAPGRDGGVVASGGDAGAGAAPDAPAPDAAPRPADAEAPPADAGAPREPDARVAAIDAAIDAPAAPATVDILVRVKNVAAFQLYENGVKLLDGPDNVPVPVGGSRTLVIKAPGFRDKTITVAADARGRKLEVRLDRAGGPGPGPGPGSGSGRKPPSDPGCQNVVVDPSSQACRAQYCQYHPKDMRCGME